MIPRDQEAEKYIIGSILSDKECHLYITKLREEDFYSAMNQAIYSVIKETHDKSEPIESMSIYVDCEKKGIINALEVLVNIEGDIATTTSIGHYYKRLKELSSARKCLRKANEFIQRITDEPNKASELKAEFQMELDSVETQKDEKKNDCIKELVEEALQDISNIYHDKDEKKLYTGFFDLDDIMAGFHRGEMTVVAARPGIGKTAFALNLLLRLANENNVVMFTLEMAAKENVKRLMSCVGGVDGHKLRVPKCMNPKEWTAITQGGLSLPNTIKIVDWIYDISQMRSYLREKKNKGELDVVIIDYLQLAEIGDKNTNRTEYVGKISRALKKFSKEFDVPIIALAQLNREAGQNIKPTMKNLRESGSIEQDADNIIFLHVEHEEDQHKPYFEIMLIIEKQRNGPTGEIRLGYEKSTFTFKNLIYKRSI